MADSQLLATAPPTRLRLSPRAIAYAVFVPTGITTVLLGPLLPLLSARWQLNDAQAGYLVSAQFTASLISTTASSYTLPRIGFRRSIVLGLLMMIAGLIALLSPSYLWGLLAVICLGASSGMTVPASSVLVARANPERSSASLSLLNFFWSLGAVLCPLLLAAFQSRGRTNAYLTGLAIAFALLLIVVLAAPLNLPATEAESHTVGHSRLSYLLTPTAFLIGALFYFYVGTEGALGIWLASYAHRATVTSGSEWITAPSYFYGALLVGRLLAPAILRRLPDATFARLSAALALLAIAALLYSRSFLGVATCAALTGLGFSALYPIAIGYLSAAFGAASQRVAGTMFALSTLGAATIPWFIGYLSNRSGSLRTALFVTLAGTLIMLCLFFLRIPKLAPGNAASGA